MKRTQIYLPKTQLDVFRKLAGEQKETVSEIIRALLRHALEKNLPLGQIYKKRPTPFDVLVEVKKLNESGPKDLAENLDRYLYGKR
ncbi:MAG: ribbon-helix-helix domain-containing protein [Patescibacteria group bacterium]